MPEVNRFQQLLPLDNFNVHHLEFTHVWCCFAVVVRVVIIKAEQTYKYLSSRSPCLVIFAKCKVNYLLSNKQSFLFVNNIVYFCNKNEKELIKDIARV